MLIFHKVFIVLQVIPVYKFQRLFVHRTMAGLKEKYTKLILANAEAVAQIESVLRTALYLVPGRFRNSELKAELGFSLFYLSPTSHCFLVLILSPISFSVFSC